MTYDAINTINSVRVGDAPNATGSIAAGAVQELQQ